MNCPNNYRWINRGGDLTCSHCGSWYPHSFIAFLQVAADPEQPDCYIEKATGKDYKHYINRPHIKNAGDGAIKFYSWHLPDYLAQNEEIQKLYREAMEVSFRKMMAIVDQATLRLQESDRPQNSE